MSVKEVLTRLVDKANDSPDKIKNINEVFQFEINGQQVGTFQVKVNDDKVEVVEGTPYEAACVFALSDEHFISLAEGKLNPAMAVMTGKVKIKGDMSKALKLQNLLK
ncbi:putative sterol carrier protein [Caldalkalibacillus uzonensis]|uniref:Sterol carrier protein n=1 Tax=Caldalkalibacillus uzonensis TaxID=353224 RepID=A0ABU0CMC4_9BACI|nr:SCP2 sterol-binding domain-containing protein [Caldalkalibacillus uzonensis]MDQ0337568.1 putative sterol carrier protein [Caldalkalibacillus uzonensis]